MVWTVHGVDASRALDLENFTLIDPKTGVEVRIPPGNTIRFKPGKELRNLL